MYPHTFYKAEIIFKRCVVKFSGISHLPWFRNGTSTIYTDNAQCDLRSARMEIYSRENHMIFLVEGLGFEES
jgi:hypothetical protein